MPNNTVPSSEQEPENQKFIVYLRFPFARNGFQDPESSNWSKEKSQELRDFLSSTTLKNGEIAWTKLANHFQVSEPFILQQAIWLYEKELDHVRGQMLKINRNINTNKSRERVKTTFKTSFPVRDASSNKPPATTKDANYSQDPYSDPSIPDSTRPGEVLVRRYSAKSGGYQKSNSTTGSTAHFPHTRNKSDVPADFISKPAGIENEDLSTQQPLRSGHHAQPSQHRLDNKISYKQPYFNRDANDETAEQAYRESHHLKMSLSQISAHRNSTNRETSPKKKHSSRLRKHLADVYQHDDDDDNDEEDVIDAPMKNDSSSTNYQKANTQQQKQSNRNVFDKRPKYNFDPRLPQDVDSNRHKVHGNESQSSKKVDHGSSFKKYIPKSRPYLYDSEGDDGVDDEDIESGQEADDESFNNDLPPKFKTQYQEPEDNPYGQGTDEENYDALFATEDLPQPKFSYEQDSYTATSESSDLQEIPLTQNVPISNNNRADNKHKTVSSSMSSFSELSDASFSKSALEDAMSNKLKLR